MSENSQVQNTPPCKYCQSSHIVKFGTYKGNQRYWCKECNRKFKGDNSLFHMKVSPDVISSALSMYYSGMSINEVRVNLKQETGYYPPSSVVYQWIDKYTDVAIKSFKEHHPQVGDTWIADETVLRIDGRNIWMYDIIDSDTRFLLATRIAVSRTSNDAQKLLEKAKRVANKNPKVVMTDKNNSYILGIKNAFNSETGHIQTSPFKVEENTTLIERLHGTLKDRTKVMRGLKSLDSAKKFTDGWAIYYNYFKPHITLDGQTPAEYAKVNYDIKNWKQVSQIPVSKESEKQSHQSPQVFTEHVSDVSNPHKNPLRKRKPYHRITPKFKPLTPKPKLNLFAGVRWDKRNKRLLY
jgi:putative transposase